MPSFYDGDDEYDDCDRYGRGRYGHSTSPSPVRSRSRSRSRSQNRQANQSQSAQTYEGRQDSRASSSEWSLNLSEELDFISDYMDNPEQYQSGNHQRSPNPKWRPSSRRTISDTTDVDSLEDDQDQSLQAFRETQEIYRYRNNYANARQERGFGRSDSLEGVSYDNKRGMSDLDDEGIDHYDFARDVSRSPGSKSKLYKDDSDYDG